MRILLLFLFWFATASSAETIQYFYGQERIYSADGSNLERQIPSLAKRSINRQTATITESVLQPSVNRRLKPEEFVTFITRGNTLGPVFSATDAEHSFTGTVTYKGTDWNWNEWTYTVNVPGGGTLQGHDWLTEGWLTSDKVIYGATGMITARIKDDWARIDEDQYWRIYKEMMSVSVPTSNPGY